MTKSKTRRQVDWAKFERQFDYVFDTVFLVLCFLVSAVVMATLIGLVFVSVVEAEELTEESCRQPFNVCDIVPEYGKVLIGSDCYDWEDNYDRVIMTCIVKGEHHQVFSNRECCELRVKYGVSKVRTVVMNYRQHWCAAICYLRSKGESMELPRVCADIYCPY